MKTMTAESALQTVQETAEAKKRATEIRVGCLAPFDEVRQGDVYFRSLDAVPAGAMLQKRKQLQLAPGTTQGSRHIITDATASNCQLYGVADATALDGPILEVVKAPVEIDHPEHGNVVFDVPGIYSVHYQRQYAEELRRVMD